MLRKVIFKHYLGKGRLFLKKIIAIMFLIITFLFSGCSSQQITKGNTLDEAISKSDRLNKSTILHKEVLEEGVLVFHIPDIKGDKAESRLGAEFVRKVLFGWEVSYKGGAYSSGIKQPLYGQYFPAFEDSPFPMVYGEIKDSNINKVVVKEPGSKLEKQARIINVKRKPAMERDMVLWYVFLDRINGKSLDIKGMTANNEVIFTLSENITIDWTSTTSTTIPAPASPPS